MILVARQRDFDSAPILPLRAECLWRPPAVGKAQGFDRRDLRHALAIESFGDLLEEPGSFCLGFGRQWSLSLQAPPVAGGRICGVHQHGQDYDHETGGEEGAVEGPIQ